MRSENGILLTKRRIDLHIHSNHSDGTLSVQELFQKSKMKGLSAISITDHDSISALPLANEMATKDGIEFVNGIEISAKGKKYDMHLLGYFFDHKHPNLHEYVEFFQNERIKRAKKIVKNLNDYGFNISYHEVLEDAGENASIGRPHIASVLVRKGLAKSYEEVFQHFLGDGCPCWVPKFKISPNDAISMIKEAGGICILAHPDKEIPDEEIFSLIKSGLDGIETVHPKHTPQEVIHFRNIVRKFNLIETGGSDFHGTREDEADLGELDVPYDFLEKMRELINC